jgi:hypothetical protein
VSSVCVAEVCQQATCSDGTRNGQETDVDCGGPTCSGCSAGDNCISASDCASGICTGGTCEAAPSCTDGTKNGSETDIDCGGTSCPKCADGKLCSVPGDCVSGICTGGICQPAPTCIDGIKNGSETDIDCGGPTCPQCANGKTCSVSSDCTSGLCSGGTCQAATTCSDGVKNGNEAAIDCGGACPDCNFVLNRIILGSTPVTGTALVTWDATNFTVVATINDPNIYDDSADPWEDDSFEVYLGLTNNKSTSFGPNDFQIRGEVNNNASGIGNVNWGAISVSTTVDASGYTMTIIIPWAALGADGSSLLGRTIGFDLGVNDDFNGGPRDGQLMMTGGDQNFNNPSLWGELTLN